VAAPPLTRRVGWPRIGLVVSAIRLTRTLRALTPARELTGPQISALAVVAYAGRIKARDLCALEEVTPAAISKLVTGMEKRGLVARRGDAADARVQWIRATPKGKRLLAAGHARRIAPLAAAIARLSAGDLATLSRAVALIDGLAADVRRRL
jgi:DNA-binding MarR family transcriptional regulator